MKFLVLVVLLALMSGLLPAQEPARQPFDAKSFPARDSHEGVTIAADSYLRTERAKIVFGEHAPNQVGVLPVELIVTNDSDRAVRLEVERCQLIVTRKKKLESLPISELIERLYYRSSDIRISLPGPRPPLPRPSKKKAPRKDVEAAEADFRSRAFRVSLVPPHSSARGFLFFDLGLPLELPPGAVLYVPDVVDEHTGQPLLYFEISLAADARAPTTPE